MPAYELLSGPTLMAVFDPDDFAASDEEAQKRFAENKSKDPLPSIAPALLNTADLLAYVALTGMIWPFRAEAGAPERWLKPASCAIPLGGPFVYWTDPASREKKPEKKAGTLADGEVLELERNSIVYLTLEPEFRLPDYIAARFNLKIRDIYRGLLVGTGPLVDPGFTGRLSIPIHNLTSNSYQLVGGEPLVWMEFTKISPNHRWDSTHRRPRGAPPTEYVPFPAQKIGRHDINGYLRHANGDSPIRSSIPELVGRAQASAEDAQAHAKTSAETAASIRRRFTQFGWVGAVAALAAIAALVLASFTVVQSAQTTDNSVQQSFQGLQNSVARQKHTLEVQAREIARLESQKSQG